MSKKITIIAIVSVLTSLVLAFCVWTKGEADSSSEPLIMVPLRVQSENKLVVPEDSVSFTIAGDTMFARSIHERFNPNFTEAFADLGDEVFAGVDAALVNLEGAITTKPLKDKAEINSFDFEFSPKVIEALNYLHITGASSANNHANNAGEEGVATTNTLLTQANIKSFGSATNSDLNDIAYFHSQGLTLAVIGINLTFPKQNPEILLPVIAKLQAEPSMRILVMPHWGTEYALEHNEWQAQAAQAWIDAGADLVIGSHPHVVQDTELYRGVPIIYSLGNFLFDQTFSTDTQRGLIISGRFTSNSLSFWALPTQSVKYRPRLMDGPAKQQMLDKIYAPFESYLASSSIGNIVKIGK